MREMKDSGVEWIGNVPAAWQTHTVGALFRVRNEKVNDTDYPPLSVSKGGIVPQMENVAKTDATDNRKMVLANDFVINSRSDRKQSCGVSSLDGSVSLINIVLYPAKGAPIAPAYLNYLLKNYGFAEEFYRWGHGIVADLWTTRWQEMKSIFLPIPEIEEQQRILAAISIAYERVDALIANVQAQIEKLKAYKQSLITEVVTKGLDPSVPMKDSGVEWIGEIPVSWIMTKLKHVGKFTSGYAFPSGDFLSDGIKVIKITNIQPMKMDFEEISFVDEKYSGLSAFIVPKGALVFALTRPIIKDGIKAAIFDSNEIMLLNQRNAMFVGNAAITTKWQFYLMLNFKFIKQFELCIDKTGQQPNISTSEIQNICILLPSTNEQQRLTDYLDKKCSQLDHLISLKQQKINKLADYKKSLIYEYVTGKKEVS